MICTRLGICYTLLALYAFFRASYTQSPVYGPSVPNKEAEKSFVCKTRAFDCRKVLKYSNIDGTCNNEKKPLYGATDSPHVRLLPADYSRFSSISSQLPTTRQISNALRETQKVFSSAVSNFHVIWGQMLSHDIARTPMTRNNDGTVLDCDCARPDVECANIDIGPNDEQSLEKDCFSLPRSSKAMGIDGCEFAQREQINDCSSFIDGTQVYGKTLREATALRDPYRPGELRTKENPLTRFLELLPTQDQVEDRQFAFSMDCPRLVHVPRNVSCFVAGDVRANENTGLAALQTVWMRYHNKIARQLKQINPQWDSDKVFNEARTIIIGLFQIITYREYLPLLLGPDLTRRFGLTLVEHGYWNGYNPEINPTVANAFTTAAFRYGHSQLSDILTRRNSRFSKGPGPDLELEDSFFNSVPLLKKHGEGVGSLMRGFMFDRAEKMDSSIVDDFRNKLFKEFGKTFGGDLLSFNIQRGRDHGLPAYNQYRELSGLRRAYSFDDLASEIPYETLSKLKSVYRSADDIDLYAGGISERSVNGGQLGPTFGWLMADGFRALRRGDRFWHEHEFSPSRFTPEQLSALRRISFSTILCDVSEYMRTIFKLPLTRNENTEKVSCDRDIPKLDIMPWKEPHRGRYGPEYQSKEWTRWFVSEAYNEKADFKPLALAIQNRQKNEVCDSIVDAQTRRVNSRYVQVRFACPPGTIQATDFPHEISDHTFWTTWLKPGTMKYGDIHHIPIKAFGCDDPLAIQARVDSGDKFARETDDALEEYTSQTGFLCRDSHQINGKCNEYMVRVLCARPEYRKAKVAEPSATFSTSSVYSSGPDGKATYVPYYFSRREAVSNPSEPRYFDKDTAKLFCTRYAICCDFRLKWYRIVHVPTTVWKIAARLCAEHHLCCDSQFEFNEGKRENVLPST